MAQNPRTRAQNSHKDAENFWNFPQISTARQCKMYTFKNLLTSWKLKIWKTQSSKSNSISKLRSQNVVAGSFRNQRFLKLVTLLIWSCPEGATLLVFYTRYWNLDGISRQVMTIKRPHIITLRPRYIMCYFQNTRSHFVDIQTRKSCDMQNTTVKVGCGHSTGSYLMPWYPKGISLV